MTSDFMSDRAFVRLKILSETLNPEKISVIIGMVPDRSWRIGDFRLHTTIVEREHGWVADSQLPPDTNIHAQVSSLIDRLAPYAAKIGSLSQNCSIAFSCVLYCRSANPGFVFEKATLEAILKLNAALDVDFYVLPSEGD